MMRGDDDFQDMIKNISLVDSDSAQSSSTLDTARSPTTLGTDAQSIGSESPFNDSLRSQKYVLVGKDTYLFTNSLSNYLGCGTFSQVYRGIQSSNNEEIAIKKMNKIECDNEELRIMDSVKSPFLVTLKDICSDCSHSYIIMELCSASLEDHLGECYNEVLPARDMRLIIDNIARGYKTLFDANIVHRDIKPQNILIKSDYNRQITMAKISDFGVSRILANDYDEMLTGIAGTCQYMAPEIAANTLVLSKYEHQADMWSIGCLFYRCITGMIPFDEAALCRLILYVACKNFEAYDKPELPESTDPEIQRLIYSLLELDNAERMTPDQLYHRAISLADSDES